MPTAALVEQFLVPPASLRGVVEHALLLTVAPGAAPVVRTLLPTFQVIVLFNLGTPAELWPAAPAEALVPVHEPVGCILLGPLKSAWHYRLRAGARVLVVNFTLAGFYRLFKVPVNKLDGGPLDPDTVLPGGCFAALWARLAALTQPAQLLAVLTEFCLPYLRAPETDQAALVEQLGLLAHSPHLNPLRVLAVASHRSERTVQLRFQKYLGFSAKEAARFLRFRRVLAAVAQLSEDSPAPDWLALVEAHGYHDQSHLIHDFAHFLHQSPGRVAGQLLEGEAICFTRPQLLHP